MSSQSSSPVYRGRFAPSPTGKIHLGTARTALVAWLRARTEGGVFVLRIEDIDRPRVVPGAAQAMLDDLRWLGLDWDEGPDVGGALGPYVQSDRLDRYAAAIDVLRAKGLAYPCSCTRKELALVASAPHGPSDEGPAYGGACRKGPLHPERPLCTRFQFEEPSLSFVDRFAGDVASVPASDFVVRRADGVFAYHLAVVVDDAEMAITEVVRGDDLLLSTSRQLALYAALGLRAPDFFHVPLLFGPDGARFAKRDGATTIGELRAAGVSPKKVVGALGFTLGLVEARAAMTPQALCDRFDPARLVRGPGHFDPALLLHAKMPS